MPRRTRVIAVDPDCPSASALHDAAEVLRNGGLVAFPTETVYGLGADATWPEAVARIFEAKGRPATNPLIVHGPDVASLHPAVSGWPATASKLAEAFWPGPLTLVLPRSDQIPEIVTAGQPTVGVRVPDHAVALHLLRAAGRPIAAPSANRSTGVSPTRAEHVRKDLDGRIELILDAGPSPVGIESTVLDLTSDPPRLLRPGAITTRQIEAVLGGAIATPTFSADAGSALASPGQMEVHYAPRTEVVLIAPEQLPSVAWPPGARIGLFVIGRDVAPDLAGPAERVDLPTPEEAARRLYETFHRWDEGALDRIVVVPPPDEEPWRAVNDRLWRASRRWARAGRTAEA